MKLQLVKGMIKVKMVPQVMQDFRNFLGQCEDVSTKAIVLVRNMSIKNILHNPLVYFRLGEGISTKARDLVRNT